MKVLVGILVLASGLFAYADDFQDRHEALVRRNFEHFERVGRDLDAQDLARAHAGAVAFGNKHGGFKVGPVDEQRDGHWSPYTTFTTADNFACHAWRRCNGTPIAISCIDGHGNQKYFGPKSCPIR